jgi:TrmH family RNA methyltransferase
MTAKAIKSLYQKKNRQQSGKFLVEGEKSVLELIASDFKITNIYGTREFATRHDEALAGRTDVKIQLVDAAELGALGTLETNMAAIAIALQKKPHEPKTNPGIILALDGISDPGNLGTLMRIADWYGITDIVCASGNVDWYNPKAISASMGSFTRINGFYTDLPAFLRSRKGTQLFGASMKGISVHELDFPTGGILVIGSESHGISREVEKCLTKKITIPRFGKAESLNAAIAGAIILDRWKEGL